MESKNSMSKSLDTPSFSEASSKSSEESDIQSSSSWEGSKELYSSLSKSNSASSEISKKTECHWFEEKSSIVLKLSNSSSSIIDQFEEEEKEKADDKYKLLWGWKSEHFKPKKEISSFIEEYLEICNSQPILFELTCLEENESFRNNYEAFKSLNQKSLNKVYSDIDQFQAELFFDDEIINDILPTLKDTQENLEEISQKDLIEFKASSMDFSLINKILEIQSNLFIDNPLRLF